MDTTFGKFKEAICDNCKHCRKHYFDGEILFRSCDMHHQVVQPHFHCSCAKFEQ